MPGHNVRTCRENHQSGSELFGKIRELTGEHRADAKQIPRAKRTAGRTKTMLPNA